MVLAQATNRCSIVIDYHFVRDKVALGDLRVHYLSTKDQIADIFTKGLPQTVSANFLPR